MTERQPVATTPEAASPERERVRRVDARRNLEAILESARLLLPEHPDASMQEIASAAGVHRATVHRHFASRDDLVAAVRLRAVEDSHAAVERVMSAAPERAADALEAVTASVLASGDTYRLYRFTTWRDEYTRPHSDDIGERIRALVKGAQEQGEMRQDLDPDQLATAWGGLISATLPLIADGGMGVEQGAAFIRTLLAPSG